MERLLPGVHVLLHEQHPAEGRRHAPCGLPRGADPEDQRIHREGGPRQARERRAHGRRRARGHDGDPLHQDAGPEVLLADQGQARLLGGEGRGGVGGRAEARRVPARAPGRRQGHLPQDHRRGPGARGRPQGARDDPPQGRARLLGPARKARGLPGEGPRQVRDLPGRGRIGRRLGQAGPRPAHPGRAAAQGQDPERREGALRQDAVVPGSGDAHQRARHRHRRATISTPGSCATTA